MKINDEGTSNAAYWHERAMKAEARLAEAERERDALQSLLDDRDYIRELAASRATDSASVRRCDAPGCDHWERHGRACETCTTSTVTADTEAK